MIKLFCKSQEKKYISYLVLPVHIKNHPVWSLWYLNIKEYVFLYFYE